MTRQLPIHRRFYLALFACLTAASIFVTQQAYAEPGQLIIETRAQALNVSDSNYEMLHEQAMFESAQLAVGYDLGNDLEGLRAYLMLQGGEASRSLFHNFLDLNLQREQILVAIEYGPTFFEILRPYARLAGGYDRQTLSFEADNTRYSDRSNGIVAYGGLGLDVFFPLRQRFTVGLTTLWGYSMATESSFENLLPNADDRSAAQQQPVDFGSLSMNGAFFDIGLVLRIQL